MGKPVLLSNYAGLPENIEPGREGWLVPVQDPRAVADALRRILEQRSALGVSVVLAAIAAESRRHDQILKHRHAAERQRHLKRARDPHAATPLRL